MNTNTRHAVGLLAAQALQTADALGHTARTYRIVGGLAADAAELERLAREVQHLTSRAPTCWTFVQEYNGYTDYEQVIDVGDEWVFCTFRATWDAEAGHGYVSLAITTDGGARELLQYDIPSQLTRADFAALTGHTFPTEETTP
jgi:hypothetical protein